MSLLQNRESWKNENYAVAAAIFFFFFSRKFCLGRDSNSEPKGPEQWTLTLGTHYPMDVATSTLLFDQPLARSWNARIIIIHGHNDMAGCLSFRDKTGIFIRDD